MKYCQKCGKEIMDEAVICVHCGCQVQSTAKITQKTTVNLSTSDKVTSFIPLIYYIVLIAITFIIATSKLSEFAVSEYLLPCTLKCSIWFIILSIIWIVANFSSNKSIYYIAIVLSVICIVLIFLTNFTDIFNEGIDYRERSSAMQFINALTFNPLWFAFNFKASLIRSLLLAMHPLYIATFSVIKTKK